MTRPVMQVAEVAVKREVRKPADLPLREATGRESRSVPRAMIPRNVNAMIRLMLTDRRAFLGSRYLLNGNILFPFIFLTDWFQRAELYTRRRGNARRALDKWGVISV